MLVGPFEIEVAGIALASFPHHGVPRRARFEPHVEDVAALLEVREGGAAVEAILERLGQVRVGLGVVRGQEVGGGQGEPRVGTLAADDLHDGPHARGRHERLAVGGLEGGDGKAPGALAGDAPVGTRLEHAAETVAAPFRDEGDAFASGVEAALAEVLGLFAGNGEGAVDADEPLLCAAEDGGGLAAPVVRVAVGEGEVVEEVARLAEVLGDELVGLPDVLAAEPRGNGGVVGAVGLHGAVDGHVLAQPRHVVFLAVSRRGVHQSGAVLERHVVGADDSEDLGMGGDLDSLARVERAHALALGRVDERVAVGQAQEGLAADAGQLDHLLALRGLDDPFDRLGGEHGDVAVDPRERVVELGVDRDGHVRRERPGRRGPDHEARPLVRTHARARRLGVVLPARLLLRVLVGVRRQAEGVVDGLRVGGLEVDVDAEVLAVVVLEFRLGQRGLVGDRPVHRLEGAEDQVTLEERGQHLQRRAFEGRRHRHVRIVVVRQRQQSLHLPRLQLDVLLRVFLAFAPDRGAAGPLVEGLELLDLAALHEFGHHLVLDGQPVAVPARRVWHVEAQHAPGADHEVLEALVHQVPEVDGSVRVRGAVVEDELGRLPPGLPQPSVDLGLPPSLHRGRLVLHQVRLHGEGGLGQVQGRPVAALAPVVGRGGLRGGGLGIGLAGGHGWGSEAGALGRRGRHPFRPPHHSESRGHLKVTHRVGGACRRHSPQRRPDLPLAREDRRRHRAA